MERPCEGKNKNSDGAKKKKKRQAICVNCRDLAHTEKDARSRVFKPASASNAYLARFEAAPQLAEEFAHAGAFGRLGVGVARHFGHRRVQARVARREEHSGSVPQRLGQLPRRRVGRVARHEACVLERLKQ